MPARCTIIPVWLILSHCHQSGPQRRTCSLNPVFIYLRWSRLPRIACVTDQTLIHHIHTLQVRQCRVFLSIHSVVLLSGKVLYSSGCVHVAGSSNERITPSPPHPTPPLSSIRRHSYDRHPHTDNGPCFGSAQVSGVRYKTFFDNPDVTWGVERTAAFLVFRRNVEACLFESFPTECRFLGVSPSFLLPMK